MREMKDSGVEWIGKIPSHWLLQKGKYVFLQRSERGNSKSLELLSPSQKYGVIPQTLLEEKTTQRAVKVDEKADLSQFKTIHCGDYCISLRSFQGGFEYSEYEGVVSPAYQVFYPIVNICDNYYRFMFKESGFIEEMNSYTMTLRDGKNIAFSDFGNSLLPLPTVQEQKRIALYLAQHCSEIDSMIADVKANIEDYKALKQTIITQAVTKGLDPDVEMKDSGNRFYPQVPSHWEMMPIKGIFEIHKEIVGKKGIDVLSVTQTGIKIKDISFNNGQMALDYSKYQVVKPGWFVMNHMDLLTGWVDQSLYAGVTSPDYRVFKIRETASVDAHFYRAIFQMCYFNRYFYGLGQGVANVGRWRLPAEQFLKFKVPVPPLPEQQRISQYIDSKCAEIDDIIADQQSLIDELEAAKKSLIYECVTGKREIPM